MGQGCAGHGKNIACANIPPTRRPDECYLPHLDKAPPQPRWGMTTPLADGLEAFQQPFAAFAQALDLRGVEAVDDQRPNCGNVRRRAGD